MLLMIHADDLEWGFEVDHIPAVGDTIWLGVRDDEQEYAITVIVAKRTWDFDEHGGATLDCLFNCTINQGDYVRSLVGMHSQSEVWPDPLPEIST